MKILHLFSSVITSQILPGSCLLHELRIQKKGFIGLVLSVEINFSKSLVSQVYPSCPFNYLSMNICDTQLLVQHSNKS